MRLRIPIFPLLLALTVFAATVPDNVLESRIRARFARSSLRAELVQVEVEHGVATIQGTVRNSARKGVATRLARAEGAREVVNRLKVAQNGNTGRPKRLEVWRPR